jgi:hypothetical protein
MKTQKLNQFVLLVISICIVSLVGQGCASKKKIWGSPETGLILKYKAPENERLSYQKSSDFTQTMEISGQNIEVKALQDFYYSMDQKNVNDQKINCSITIDSVDYSISSPRGQMNPDMSSIIGESFNMDLTSLGYEENLDEAKAIKYSLEGEEQSVVTIFSALFPQLPDHPVKVGDSWKSVDTVYEESGRGDLMLIFHNFNTLVSLENVKGLDCVKVDTKVTGSMSGGGKQEDVTYDYDGEIEGAGTWYFAYKEGLLVEEKGEGTGHGTLIVPARDMKIPMAREFRIEHTLMR